MEHHQLDLIEIESDFIYFIGSYVEQYFQSTRTGVPGKADEIIRQASLCTLMCFLTRSFLLRPPAQDTHAYDMIGRIIAVYIHFIIDGFIPHVLPTICLHCINAEVALRVSRVICGFQLACCPE